MLYKASAPGSTMFFGEHAVLEGHPAIVLAIEPRLTLSFSPLTSDTVEIFSDRFGHYKTDLQTLAPRAPFQFVLAVIAAYRNFLSQGFALKIESDLSHEQGLGSSAAVTVALVALLEVFLFSTFEPWSVFIKSRDIIRAVQGGVASGMDALASSFGGLQYYHPRFNHHESLAVAFLPLYLIYVGYKTPTPTVIRRVQTLKEKSPALVADCFEQIEALTEQAVGVLQHETSLSSLGALMTAHQQIQKRLGLTDPHIDKLLYACKPPYCLGAKLSGSGLGDCILTLGQKENIPFPDATEAVLQFPIQWATSGVEVNQE